MIPAKLKSFFRRLFRKEPNEVPVTTSTQSRDPLEDPSNPGPERMWPPENKVKIDLSSRN